MRRRHFEALRPLCPVCRAAGRDVFLEIAAVESETGGETESGGDILEAVLRCAAPSCQHEYPILDGIPLLVPRLREYVAGNLAQIHARDDLSATAESLLGDATGPGSAFDTIRQHLSSYAWDHWADLDPGETSREPSADATPGSILRLLERALAEAGELPAGPRLDLGCAVGRTSFALAGTAGEETAGKDGRNDLILGVDLHYAMLRTASRALRRGVLRYPRRRVGLVYDVAEFPVELPGRQNVDFWCADATALPFLDGTFAAAAALNVLDCVASPLTALEELARLLIPGGKALLTSPYDWSPAATPVEAWLGGHSQRGPDSGASEPLLRRLLTPGAHPASIDGLRLLAEAPDLPWHVRLHARSVMRYRAHLVVAERPLIAD